MQLIQGFFTPVKNLQTKLFDIKIKEKSISYEDSSVALEIINIVRNPLFESIEQQSLKAKKTNICCTTNQFIFPTHGSCNTCAPSNGNSGTKCITNTITQHYYKMWV